MKSSFILHIDSLCILDDLDDVQKGQLFFAIYKYQLGEEIDLPPLIKIAFSQFKNQFIRDNETYQKTVKARKIAGSKGGKKKVANATKSKQKVANLAVSDKDSVSVSDSVKDIHLYPNINISALEEWLNHKKYKSKAPVTKVLNMMNRYSHEQQQQMVDSSIMNGWKGLFEPKGQQQQTQSFKQQDETREQEKSNAINKLLDAGFNPFSQADWDKLSEYEARLMQEHQGVIDVQPTQRIS